MRTSPQQDNTQAAAVPSSLRTLIQRLEQHEVCDPQSAAALLTDSPISAADLQPWYDFDHPLRDSYGRLLVQAGANYELMVMSWAPGDYSAIHDHGDAEWGAVRYFGAADHAVFSTTDQRLSLHQRITMQENDVCAVDHDLIHLMGNPSDQPFVTLHLYGCAAPTAAVTRGARIFDLIEQRIQRTDDGVFFCLPDSAINAREWCPEGDYPTRRLHHQLMLARLQRIAGSGQMDGELNAKLAQVRQTIAQLEHEAPPR